MNNAPKTLIKFTTPSPDNARAPGAKASSTRKPRARRKFAASRAPFYEPEQDALKLIARQGKFANSYFRVGVLLGREECHDGWALKHGARIIRRDVEAEHQFPAEERTLAEGLHSYCAVPLIVRGESIGVVTLLSRRKNQFSERHAEFLQQAANQIVLAIKSFNPHCSQHLKTKLFCPRCIASSGGQKTTTKYKEHLSNWGKRGGRGKKNRAGGLTNSNFA